MIYDPGDDELCAWSRGHWVPTRVCSCGMCRFFPEQSCPGNQYGGGAEELRDNPNAVQLYRREYQPE